MQALIGIGFLAALVGAAGGLTVHVYRKLKADGRLPLPKVPRTTPAGAKIAGRPRARAQAARGTRTARIVWAEARATNWLAAKEHKRNTPKPSRRSLLHRLVAPGGAIPPVPGDGAAVPVSPAPSPVKTAPAQPVPSANGRHLKPVPDPAPAKPGGTPMPSTTPTGAAADFFSAISAVTGRAKAGGIREKAAAIKTLTAGFEQQAAALEEFARHMSEPGQEYPAMVFEPLTQMSTHLRAAAMSGGEADNGLATLMHMPVGELAASSVHAPHNSELNTA